MKIINKFFKMLLVLFVITIAITPLNLIAAQTNAEELSNEIILNPVEVESSQVYESAIPEIQDSSDTQIVQPNFSTQSVLFDLNDVTKPSGVTVDELTSGLLSSMKPLAPYFIQAEKEHGVNAIFLSSIAGIESHWGTSDWAKNYNNLFGFNGKQYFDSKQNSIFTVAKALKKNYLSTDGIYFKGTSPKAVEFFYCNPDYNDGVSWGDAISVIMTQIGNRIVDFKNENGQSMSKIPSLNVKFEAFENQPNEITEYLISMEKYNVGKVVDDIHIFINQPQSVELKKLSLREGDYLDGGKCPAPKIPQVQTEDYSKGLNSQIKKTITLNHK